ncbi:hypothetical protein ACFOG5_12435 [Pedobacter fastidiosus]|uniref:Uncharacterized protein n=1 Tax=Pedobacter fastidiosus TaxID=2765361 RepID=A0ABR7KM49_9SPHI|nr:hypothetical protein [Pedobacter fastidiosus]MBC6109151.1 hypothetical protein [Pedobacter fastidiosus]
MHLKSKLNNHPKSKTTILFLCLLLLFANSCKKDAREKEQLEPVSTKKNVLLKSSPDFESRLEAIKKSFYLKKLDKKLRAKVNPNLNWVPDWSHPSAQVVSDSVSYVFYPLIGNLTKDGKLLIVEEQGSKSYLIIKNEKNFYCGMYYLPVNQNDPIPNNPPGRISLKNFTGNLLLRNLEKTESFIIDYKNGVVSEAYKKRGVEILKKVGANRQLLSSIETICHTEMSYCVYLPDSYACGGSLGAVMVVNCNMNPNWCGVTWSLVEYSEQQVCENVWFPDPPTNPEDNGGSGGGSGGGDDAEGGTDSNYLLPPPPESPIVNMKKFFSCFDQSRPAKLTVYAQKTFKSLPGHAFITIKQGANVMTVGFYPRNEFPATISGPGIMGDDSGHRYTVATNYGDITADQLKKIMNVFIAYSLTDYNLATNNCANPVLDTLNIIGVTDTKGITMPDTIWKLIQPYATSNDGNAPQTKRTCNSPSTRDR